MQPVRKVHTLGFALAVALGGFSVAHADPAPTAQAASGAATQSGKSTLNATERQMLTRIAQANMAEVAAAELAKTKSSDPDVLKFADQMIKDHTQGLKDVSEVASRTGVTMPKDAGRAHAKTLKELNGLSGKKFDQQYMAKVGVEAHQETKRLVENLRQSDNAELKALGEKMMPVIDSHLKMAQERKPAK